MYVAIDVYMCVSFNYKGALYDFMHGGPCYVG